MIKRKMAMKKNLLCRSYMLWLFCGGRGGPAGFQSCWNTALGWSPSLPRLPASEFPPVQAVFPVTYRSTGGPPCPIESWTLSADLASDRTPRTPHTPVITREKGFGVLSLIRELCICCPLGTHSFLSRTLLLFLFSFKNKSSLLQLP